MNHAIKTVNLVVAILYTVFFVMIFITIANHPDPNELLGTVLLVGPLILNWISFMFWKPEDPSIKIANLVISIIYTLILVGFAIDAVAIGDAGLFLGIVIFVPPTVANWLSYFYWPKLAAPVPQPLQ
jgi:hypothetical protein